MIVEGADCIKWFDTNAPGARVNRRRGIPRSKKKDMRGGGRACLPIGTGQPEGVAGRPIGIDAQTPAPWEARGVLETPLPLRPVAPVMARPTSDSLSLNTPAARLPCRRAIGWQRFEHNRTYAQVMPRLHAIAA